MRLLRGFQRITLRAGERGSVHFELGAEDVGFWTNDAHGRFVVEPGTIELYTGTSSLASTRRTLRID